MDLTAGMLAGSTGLLPAPLVPGRPPAAPGRTGFVYDDIYLEHSAGRGHPERPERLQAIVDRLRGEGILAELRLIGAAGIDRSWLEQVHEAGYIDLVRMEIEVERRPELSTGDTGVCPRSYEAARFAAGGVLAAVDAVVAGEAVNAFCAVRPPGHHAGPGRGMGFCIFNNVAVAARYAQAAHGLERILIVDWDVHHGNGTQDTFYADPTVFYFSTHQYPFYPGTGAAREIGEGAGRGTTLNVPLPAGTGDEELIAAFTDRLVPAAADFAPDLVLISAGFDARADDLIGGFRVSDAGFAELTGIVQAIARESASGRIVSVLEGGYSLDGLARAVEAHIRRLMAPA